MNSTNGIHPAIERAWSAAVMDSDPIPKHLPKVKGYDFNEGVQYDKIFAGLTTMGFQFLIGIRKIYRFSQKTLTQNGEARIDPYILQRMVHKAPMQFSQHSTLRRKATHLGLAIEAVNCMLDCKLQAVPKLEKGSFHKAFISEGRRTSNCTIMLGYTSNMVSSGNREVLRYLAEHNMVDCIVTTAGGIEEDLIKCLHSFYIGDFTLQGADLHQKHYNRTGNLIAPNSGYSKLHAWLTPILDAMSEEQKNGVSWTPSKMIWRLGKEINNTESIYYWAQKNKIPVFSPAITDGALGDVMYYHRHVCHGNSIRLDIVEDLQMINDMAVFSINTGALILGAGLVKHHILNANCARQGSDYAIYVNTSADYDGSDAGASPDEAVSWGKIKETCRPVKVFADATIVFPVMVAETFAKRESEIRAFYKRQEDL